MLIRGTQVLIIIIPLIGGEGYTYLALFFRPKHIFISSISRTADNSHLIFGVHAASGSVPILCITISHLYKTYFLFTDLFIFLTFMLKCKTFSHFSQELLKTATYFLVCSLNKWSHAALTNFTPI